MSNPPFVKKKLKKLNASSQPKLTTGQLPIRFEHLPHQPMLNHDETVSPNERKYEEPEELEEPEEDVHDTDERKTFIVAKTAYLSTWTPPVDVTANNIDIRWRNVLRKLFQIASPHSEFINNKVKRLKIMLLGPSMSGKSEFINTICSILSPSTESIRVANAHRSSKPVTTEVKEYYLDSVNITLVDTPGKPLSQQVQQLGSKEALQFKRERRNRIKSKLENHQSKSLEERVHSVLAFYNITDLIDNNLDLSTFDGISSIAGEIDQLAIQEDAYAVAPRSFFGESIVECFSSCGLS